MTRASHTLLALPGIGVAMLPKLLCPLCWPAYASIVSSLGLGFLVGTTYLLPITASFLGITLWVLALRAHERDEADTVAHLPPELLAHLTTPERPETRARCRHHRLPGSLIAAPLPHP